MARGVHRSPQVSRFSRRPNSQKKTLKLLNENREVLSKIK